MDGLAHAWPQLVVLAEVAAAMLLGGMIGYERETEPTSPLDFERT